MIRNRLVLTLTIIILLLLLTATFFACDSNKPSVKLVIEGEAYRGAVCSIYAVVKNIENHSDSEFSIVEDYDWVLIQNDKLLFTKDAVVGATVTVNVTVNGLTDSVTLTVENTPVEAIEIEDVPELKAGDQYTLISSVSPHYADDVQISYSIVKGENIASIVDGVLTISNEADYTDELQIKAQAGGKESEIVTVKISTIQPQTLTLSATSYKLKRGEQTQISCEVTPSNCTIGTAELIVPESEYYSYSQSGVLTISNTAPEGEIEIQAKLGALVEKITITIEKTPVEVIRCTSNSSPFVKYGEVVELKAEVIPENATYPKVEISILEGKEYIELKNNIFKVTTKEVGKQIVLLAEADGIKANIAFETVEIPVENFEIIVNGGVSVSVGEKRKIEVEVTPIEATEKNPTYTITEGEEYAVLEGNEILFVNLSERKTEVTVSVAVEKITKTITFYIVPIPVESVVISTTDKTTELKPNDTVTFNATVTPQNASFSSLTYYFEMGEQLGSISGNVFTVDPMADSGRVMIYAMSDDGIKSNTLVLEMSGNMRYIKPTRWSEVDNKSDVFADMKSVILDLSSLPSEANNTTIIVSDDVQYIEIAGGVDGNNSIYDLYFYFLTTDYVYVLFDNLKITANDGFGDYVVDFGSEATVTLEAVGESEIVASSVYKLNADSFMVEGVITGEATDYLRKNGMDGIGGRNGGTAINAYNLEITGKGNLKLVAGSGADGTDATRGANSASGVFAGNGGNGGYGGDSGFAIFANTFVCNIKGLLHLVGGNAGIGGDGGLGGLSEDGEYNGSNGKKGTDGIVHYPIFTSEQSIFLTDNYTVETGKNQSNSEVRTIVYDEFAEQLATYYKIGVHYGTDLNNPHSSRFAMKELTTVNEIARMLCSLEFALQALPKNLYLEIMQDSQMINIYIVESITRRPSSIVYGLTSNVNNVWFATFTTRLRGIYYSTPLNIMIHELFHVLTYNLDDATDDSLKSTLPSYNLGYRYTTNSTGVYDPTKGYAADNSVFLCSYSKSDYNEDISDNISLIAMLTTKPDYLEKGTPFYNKVVYITSVYVGYYKNLTDNTVLRWKKYL